MRPILFQIPAIPAAGWIALIAVFFGLSAYWGVRDLAAEETPADERRRRQISTVVTNAVIFLAGALLIWKYRAAVGHPLPVRAYGFMLMIGFGAGLLLIQRLARGSVLPPEGAIDLILGILLVAIVCSRVLFVLLNWGDYAGNWREWMRVWEGGLSFHGGLIGGIGWVVWYTRRHKLRFLWLADMIAPALALGYAFARVGCFLNGCCYGTPTSLPWGVRFHEPPLSSHLTEPSHPVQLYAVVANLAICLFLARVLPRKRYDGQVTGLYFVLYSIYRFLAEGLRKGVTGQIFALDLTQGQWVSLATLALGIALMVILGKRAAASGTPVDLTGGATAAEAPEPAAPRKAKKRRK